MSRLIDLYPLDKERYENEQFWKLLFRSIAVIGLAWAVFEIWPK